MIGLGLGIGLRGVKRAVPAYSRLVYGYGGNTAAPVVTAGDNDPDHADVYGGDYRPQHPRIPLLVRATNGDILASYSLKSTDNATNADKSQYAYAISRSSDKGNTWSAPHIIVYATGHEAVNFNDQIRTLGMWVNPASGRIHIVYIKLAAAGATAADWKRYSSYSDDHGETWSAEVEITSATMPSSAAAPFDVTGASAWGFTSLYCRGVTAADGRGIIIGQHRTTADNSGTARTHCLVCTDDTNWVLGGGPLESNTANDDTIEPHAARRSDDTLFVICHNKTNSKAMATICPADGLGTWQDYAVQDGIGLAVDGITTSTDLQGVGCPYGIETVGGKLYLQAPCDANVLRSHLKVWESSDDGVTWPVSRILHHNSAGYSDLLAVDAGSFMSFFEGTTATRRSDVDSVTGSTNAFYAQGLMLARWPLTWLTRQSNYLRDSHWVFNEATSGAIPTTGRPIKDRGNLRSDAYGGPAGTFTATGIAGDGTGVAVYLCDHVRATDAPYSLPASVHGSATDPYDGSLTIEITNLNISTATTGAVLLSSQQSGTGSGFKISRSVTANALLIAFIDNAGTPVSKVLTTTAVWGTSVTATLRVEYDKTANQLRAYKDGVACYSAATSLTGHGNIVSAGLALCLGSNYDGTGTEAAFTCGPIRITRGIRTDFLVGTESRESLTNFLGGYTSSATFDPRTDLPGLKMWVGRTDDGGYSARHDYEGGFDVHALPMVAGRSARSMVDQVMNQQWDPSHSYYSGWWWYEDDFVGPHWIVPDSGFGPYITRARVTAASETLDYPQTTGVFTFFGCFNRRSFATSLILFDSNNYAADVGTLFLLPTTNLTLGSFINKTGPVDLVGGASYFNHGVTWALDTWYALAIVGRGAGVPVEYYVKPFTSGQTAPVFTTNTGATGNLGTPAAGASTQPCVIGQKQDGSQVGQFSFKNVMMFDNALGADAAETAENLNLLCNFSANY